MKDYDYKFRVLADSYNCLSTFQFINMDDAAEKLCQLIKSGYNAVMYPVIHNTDPNRSDYEYRMFDIINLADQVGMVLCPGPDVEPEFHGFRNEVEDALTYIDEYYYEKEKEDLKMNMIEKEFNELLIKAIEDTPAVDKKKDSCMSTYEIYHYIYGDVCDDAYYGKSSVCHHIGFVVATEDEVKSLVNEINAKRRCIFPKSKPSYEFDRDYNDADYITYRIVKISTFDEIRNHYRCK